MRWLIPFLLALVAGCSTRPATLHGIPNFAQVAPGVYRGGEPAAEGWAYLKSLGVHRVVKLNCEPSLPSGMETIHCEIPFFDQLFEPPKVDTVCRAVDAIKPGTFVHCEHGQDRTGLIIAEWRVYRCDWTREQARKEMLAMGFHRILFGLDWYWERE